MSTSDQIAQPPPACSTRSSGALDQGLARRERGNVAVEFALVIMMFLTLLFGVIELSRWLYAVDAAQEAAREGARTAVVCSPDSDAAIKRMQPALLTMVNGTTTISYLPSGCCANQASCSPTQSPCEAVTVSLTGYEVPSVSWIFPKMSVPDVTTYLTRESLDGTSLTNSRCTG